ncbi:MAG: Rieske 2Fe-2S domain-containing protein [Microthrixaceae bacterium]
MVLGPVATSRSPFPVPFGWFTMAYSEELAVGDVTPLEYFGRHLVMWRDNDGVAHVSDAFCPHLGAHFGHGGVVENCELVCPFHGWRFDADGNNTLIPYSDRVNKREVVRPYPTMERNGMILAWYHPTDAPPTFEVPEQVECGEDSDAWTDPIHREFFIEAPWQEIAENGVDAAHFRYVHNTEEVPELERYETDGPTTSMRSIQKFPTPRGVVDGRIDADSTGPGFSVIHFSGIVDTMLMGCATPIDANRCQMRFTFRVKKMGDEATESTVGQAFADEVSNQVLEDMPIWENKAHLVRPALADQDGPFMKFRKWASQFYAEPVADEAAVYPPQGSFPAEERELTASKKFGNPDPAFRIEA